MNHYLFTIKSPLTGQLIKQRVLGKDYAQAVKILAIKNQDYNCSDHIVDFEIIETAEQRKTRMDKLEADFRARVAAGMLD